MMRLKGKKVYQQSPGLDQRLSELQAHIDELNSSLRLWFHAQDRRPPVEQRLEQLTDRCSEIINQWTTVGARHEQAVGELETRVNELNAIETRVQHDASGRIHDLERAVEHEWSALRQIHEEPVRELRAQAASLTDVALAAATAAQRGLERSEARLAALESDLHRGMRELARDVQAAVAELRSRSDRQPGSIADSASAWPLEGVMRLHSQVRQSGEASESSLRALHAPDERAISPVIHQLPEQARALSDRINSLEQAVTDGQTDFKAAAERSERAGRNWRLGLVVLTLGVVGAGGLVWRLERQASAAAAARVAEAEHQAQIATEATNRQLTAVREDAARQIAAARETALKAQTISDVLAAPDLVRYNLIGGNEAARFSAQALWSRSRGFVFSGSRLPKPRAGSTYQIWLSTAGAPVSAGVFVPDASGRITLATDSPPRVPRPVLGVIVTVEPEGGSETPSTARLLARATDPPSQ